ncbi:MAG: DUF3854 domain-containing protein [Xenococcaceae cyanobacterium]
MKNFSSPEQKLEQQRSTSSHKSPQERVDEWISGSAVSPELTEKWLEQQSDKKEIARLLAWKYYSHTPGWYVRSCDPHTGMRGDFGQFKPDSPLQFPDSDKPCKYFTFPKGRGTEAIYSVMTLNEWISISERVGVDIETKDIDESRDDLGFWRWVMNHPEIPIIITEGVKKQGCLLTWGWVAIALTGVWNGQQKRKLHPSLKPFIVPGRVVYACFDADVVVKVEVERALKVFGQVVRREGASVFIINWNLELGKGCDDLIVNEGYNSFEEALHNATPYSEWLKSLKTEQPKKKGSLVAADVIGGSGGGNNNGNGGGGNNGGDGSGGDRSRENNEKKNPEWRYKNVADALELPFSDCVTAGSFDGYVYREIFGAGTENWAAIDTAFYHNTEQGYWQHQEDKFIHKLICDASQKAYKLKSSKLEGWWATYPYETNSSSESAFKFVRKRLELDNLPSNVHLRAFNNCTVDMRTGQTMLHDPAHFLTSQVPYDYYPNRPCPENFYNFICSSFGEDLLCVIRAFTSMFLDPTAPYGRFPHLFGPSGSGKGVMGRLWSSMYGTVGSASLASFEELASAEGRHQYLTGKSICGIPDVGGYVKGLRAFYELIDNGEMSGRALFNPTGYQKLWNMRFWVASVDHLQIENAGDGWARRAYPIPTKGKPDNVDPNLRVKLEAEIGDIISWALAMPREERDRILLGEPTNSRVINAITDAALYGDSTKSFVDLCLRPSDNPGNVPNHMLHSWYVAYCDKHGYTPMGMSKFISHLKTILPKNHVQRGWSPMTNGKRSQVSAHWEYIVSLRGALVTINNGADNGYQGSANQEPEWKCMKSKCVEGGLFEFEDFWNPPEPPGPPQPPQPPQPPEPDDGGPGGGGPDNNPPTADPAPDSDSKSPEPPSSKGVQGVHAVQGSSENPESLKQRSGAGVQGVQGGSHRDPDFEKISVAVVEKNEVAQTVERVESPLSTPVQLPVTSYQLPVGSNQLAVDSNQLAVEKSDNEPSSVTSYQLPVTSETPDSDGVPNSEKVDSTVSHGDKTSDNQPSSVTSDQLSVTSETPDSDGVAHSELVDPTKNQVTGNCSLVTEEVTGNCSLVTEKVTGNCSLVTEKELVTDYSTYPHLTSNDVRACRNRASRCKNQMLACTNRDELAEFRASAGFSQSEIDWVWERLTDSEKFGVHKAVKQEQLTLPGFEKSENGNWEQVTEEVTGNWELVTETEQTAPVSESTENASTDPEQIESTDEIFSWNEVIEDMNQHLKLLCWRKADGSAYLQHKYNLNCCPNLSESEMSEFYKFQTERLAGYKVGDRAIVENYDPKLNGRVAEVVSVEPGNIIKVQFDHNRRKMHIEIALYVTLFYGKTQ